MKRYLVYRVDSHGEKTAIAIVRAASAKDAEQTESLPYLGDGLGGYDVLGGDILFDSGDTDLRGFGETCSLLAVPESKARKHDWDYVVDMAKARTDTTPNELK